ncbi:HdeA/HdeB family chaperone [Candidatus Magnetaquicoccus inordinatus]|uniref:HdeA/HdeB family chaperone n=1 Tax=Candidatus Magnetaquicoccus inordinatus TaxID=2496818 RepID=UPI00187D2AA5|nr:HdeA/HdeB family chaperone [Candidatus Magnetaquicoccus inordinatus]
MKKLILASVVSIMTLATTQVADAKRAVSPDIDFGRYTCQQFLEEVANSGEDDVGALLLWLDGYLSGVTGDTVLKWKEFEQFTEKLVNRCSSRGGEKLLDAARKVGVQ